MNPRLIEFALRKQRLQINAERQRDDMMYRLAGFESALDTVDRVRDGVDWAREHAPLLSGALILLIVSKPRLALRLAKRAWLGWMIFRRVQGSPGSKTGLLALPLVRRVAGRIASRVVGRFSNK
ncbi:MAG: YqjK-like family protein [Azoarcus sp.]|nr:YqjK-like family protein [Azoarcus sp.]